MLQICVHETELFDEETNEFVHINATTLKLEHSLLSISKWEAKWHKPFISDEKKTQKEMLDYIRCMTISQNVDNNVYLALSEMNFVEIKNYIDDKMSATWFNDKRQMPKSKQKVITSELIYCWMISANIPVEFEKWHLNRLLTLIRVCNIENSPKKNMKKGDIYKQNRELNEKRRRLMHSNG